MSFCLRFVTNVILDSCHPREQKKLDEVNVKHVYVLDFPKSRLYRVLSRVYSSNEPPLEPTRAVTLTAVTGAYQKGRGLFIQSRRDSVALT